MPEDLSVDLSSDGLLNQPAPEAAEPNKTSPTGAYGHFRELISNPEFKRIQELFRDDAMRTLDGVTQLPVDSIGDVLQRERLFGEIAVLRRLDAEVNSRLEYFRTQEEEQ